MDAIMVSFPDLPGCRMLTCSPIVRAAMDVHSNGQFAMDAMRSENVDSQAILAVSVVTFDR